MRKKMTCIASYKAKTYVIISFIFLLLSILEIVFVLPITGSAWNTYQYCKYNKISKTLEAWTSDLTFPYYRAESNLSIFAGDKKINGEIIIVNSSCSEPVVHLSPRLSTKYNVTSGNVTYFFDGSVTALEVGAPIPSFKLLSENTDFFSSDVIVVEGLQEYLKSSPHYSYEIFAEDEYIVAWGGNTVWTTREMFFIKLIASFIAYLFVRYITVASFCNLLEKTGLVCAGEYYVRLERIGVSSLRIRFHYLLDSVILCIPSIVTGLVAFIFFNYHFGSLCFFWCINFFSILHILHLLKGKVEK